LEQVKNTPIDAAKNPVQTPMRFCRFLHPSTLDRPKVEHVTAYSP
jgi:hypothetical protein